MATYYIATDGNNGNSGAEGDEWATGDYAYTQMSANDTVIYEDGTYNWTSNDVTINTSGLTFKARNAGEVILDGSGGNVQWRTNSTVTWDGLVFYNTTTTSNGGALYLTMGGGEVITFESCQFKDLIIETDATYKGMIAYNGNQYVWDFVMNNCLIDAPLSTAGGSFYFWHGYSDQGAGSEFTLTNNTFYNPTHANDATTFFYDLGNVDFVCKNNIAYSNTSIAFQTGSEVTEDTTHNCFYNATNYDDGGNNITSDPLFVDAPNSNFNLRPTSPCIDTGVLV